MNLCEKILYKLVDLKLDAAKEMKRGKRPLLKDTMRTKVVFY